MSVPTITGPELNQKLQAGETPVLLDVREPEELEVSKLDSVINIPLAQIPDRAEELDKDAEIVVICRSGNRSNQAASYLLSHGFSNVSNLVGGMNGWATEVDTSLPVY